MSGSASRFVRLLIDRRDEAVEVLRELLRAAEHGTDAIQRRVADLYREAHAEVSEIAYHPSEIELVEEYVNPELCPPGERVAVVGRVPGRDDGPGLLVWAHPDGLPFDGAEGWTRPPFAGEVDGDKIYGWSVADDLSGVAATIMLARILSESATRPKRCVLLASTPSKDHASGVLVVLEQGFNVGAGIYLHPAESGNGLGDLKALAPGMLRFQLTVPAYSVETEEPNHTLWAPNHDKPLMALARLLAQLRSYVEAQESRCPVPEVEHLTGRSAHMLVSAVRGGESISRAPEVLMCTVTLSVAPGQSVRGMMDDIERVIGETAANDPWLRDNQPSLTWLFGTAGVRVPAASGLYRRLKRAVADVTGDVPRYYAGHIASEIRQPMLKYGVPSIGLGPRAGGLSQAGKQDEWLDIPEYLQTIAICAEVAIDPPSFDTDDL